MKGPKRLPHKHALGVLQTNRGSKCAPIRSKLTRDRIRRWAKRASHERDLEQ
jgi:hypothetical protein